MICQMVRLCKSAIYYPYLLKEPAPYSRLVFMQPPAKTIPAHRADKAYWVFQFNYAYDQYLLGITIQKGRNQIPAFLIPLLAPT
jgi:hypothetical protein